MELTPLQRNMSNDELANHLELTCTDNPMILELCRRLGNESDSQERIEELESELEDSENRVSKTQDECNEFEKQIHQLENKLDDLDSYNKRLLSVAKEAEQVMFKNIYPKPDVPNDHPFAVLSRLRETISEHGA